MQEPEYSAFGKYLMSKSEDWLWDLGNNRMNQFIREYRGNRRFRNMSSNARGWLNTNKKMKRGKMMKMMKMKKTMRKTINK